MHRRHWGIGCSKKSTTELNRISASIASNWWFTVNSCVIVGNLIVTHRAMNYNNFSPRTTSYLVSECVTSNVCVRVQYDLCKMFHWCTTEWSQTGKEGNLPEVLHSIIFHTGRYSRLLSGSLKYCKAPCPYFCITYFTG